MLELEDDDEEEVEEGAPAWMATFSDMATLLLTFFVLLLSFANMDAQQFREMLGSVRDAFGVQRESAGDFQARASSPISLTEGGSPARPSVLAEETGLARVRHRIRELGLEREVEAQLEVRGVVLRLRDGLLFESGSDAMLSEGRAVLERMSVLVRESPHDVAVEGHTDDRRIHTSRFPSNWELSAARATAVLRQLVSTGMPAARMQIAGYADTRPVADNATDEGRAANRRVEIVFLDDARHRARVAERGARP